MVNGWLDGLYGLMCPKERVLVLFLSLNRRGSLKGGDGVMCGWSTCNMKCIS